MLRLLLCLLLLLSNYFYGQSKIPAYVTGQGDTVRVGDKVRLGPGTMPDGTYKYVDGLATFNSNSAGQMFVVKAIVRQGNKKIGYSYYLRLYPGAGIANYQAQLDYSIISGEIQLSKDFTPQGKPLNNER